MYLLLISSRAEVEKQKANMKIRSQACEDAKQEYVEQLRKTNEAQRLHYEQRLPYVFKQLQVCMQLGIRGGYAKILLFFELYNVRKETLIFLKQIISSNGRVVFL